MAGFHHGDPYYPANGWIDAEEEDEEPMEVEDEEPMEVEEEESESEDEDEEPLDMFQPEELLGEESDEGSDEEVDVGEVVNEPHPIRSRELPLPPPAFQVYRHPNGPMWMNTHRKRVLPIRALDSILMPTFSQDQEPPPRWATQLHGWSRELGLRPPYGMSRAYFDLSEGTSAVRALPVMVGQMSRMDVQARAIRGQLADVGAEALVTAVRVRRMDE